MLKGLVMNSENLADNTPSVFVKVNKETRIPEKCWEGEVTMMTKRTDKVWFQFTLGKLVECPPMYVGSPDGWYADETA